MKLRILLACVFGLVVASSVTGCGGTYSPKKDGVCNPGRVWVPPQKGEDGEWKAGYCTWADQAPN